MAAGQSTRFAELPDLPASPYQPLGFVFTKCPFGKAKVVYCSFQESWFKEWPLLLHYDKAKDVTFYHSYLCNSCKGEENTSFNC